MIGYGFLGAAALLSLLGAGLMALVILTLTLVVAVRVMRNSGEPAAILHAAHIRKTAWVGLVLHLLLLVHLILEMRLAIQTGEAQSVAAAFFVRYVVDHVVEFAIGVFLAVRSVKGVLNLGESRCPKGYPVVASHSA